MREYVLVLSLIILNSASAMIQDEVQHTSYEQPEKADLPLIIKNPLRAVTFYRLVAQETPRRWAFLLSDIHNAPDSRYALYKHIAEILRGTAKTPSVFNNVLKQLDTLSKDAALCLYQADLELAYSDARTLWKITTKGLCALAFLAQQQELGIIDNTGVCSQEIFNQNLLLSWSCESSLSGAFSPTGQYAGSISQEKGKGEHPLQVWDVANDIFYELEISCRQHNPFLTISDTGKLFFLNHCDNLVTMQLSQESKKRPSPVLVKSFGKKIRNFLGPLAVTSQGDRLVISHPKNPSPFGNSHVNEARETIVFDVPSRGIEQTIPETRPLRSLFLDPQGTMVITCPVRAQATWWDLRSNKAIRTLPHPSCWAAALSPDATTIATGDLLNDQSIVHLWDSCTGSRIHKIVLDPDERVLQLAFDPQTTQLAIGTNQEIKLVYLRMFQEVSPIPETLQEYAILAAQLFNSDEHDFPKPLLTARENLRPKFAGIG
jgi:hypothetical protein